jgi:Cu-processing system permease protein
MRAALHFASMTVTMLTRRRTVWGVCLLTMLALLAIGSIPSYGTGASSRFILDLGLSSMEIGSLLLAIAMGSGIYTRDRDSRTILPLLAAPLSRDEYLAGRFLGAALVQVAFGILWCAGLAVVLLARGQPVPGGLVFAGLLTCAEGCFLLSVVMLFSLWTSPPLNAPLTVLLFIMASMGARSFSSLVPWASREMGVMRILVPHLTVFHVDDPVVHGFSISPGYAALGILYGISYTLFVLSLASAVLSSRDMR